MNILKWILSGLMIVAVIFGIRSWMISSSMVVPKVKSSDLTTLEVSVKGVEGKAFSTNDYPQPFSLAVILPAAPRLSLQAGDNIQLAIAKEDEKLLSTSMVVVYGIMAPDGHAIVSADNVFAYYSKASLKKYISAGLFLGIPFLFFSGLLAQTLLIRRRIKAKAKEEAEANQ